jgi:hypothetical protein
VCRRETGSFASGSTASGSDAAGTGGPSDYAEYRRCGTANVFCGVQPKAGRHFTKVTDNRSSPEFADYLLEIAAAYPEADTIHLVMDNLSSHTRKAVVERFGERGRRLAVESVHGALHLPSTAVG